MAKYLVQVKNKQYTGHRVQLPVDELTGRGWWFATGIFPILGSDGRKKILSVLKNEKRRKK